MLSAVLSLMNFLSKTTDSSDLINQVAGWVNANTFSEAAIKFSEVLWNVMEISGGTEKRTFSTLNHWSRYYAAATPWRRGACHRHSGSGNIVQIYDEKRKNLEAQLAKVGGKDFSISRREVKLISVLKRPTDSRLT